jgi:hypothetical protein
MTTYLKQYSRPRAGGAAYLKRDLALIRDLDEKAVALS